MTGHDINNSNKIFFKKNIFYIDMDKIFWIENPKILFDNYLNMIPHSNMNNTELFNTCTLLLIYIIIFILIFLNKRYVLIPSILILMLVILYYTNIPENIEQFNSNLTYNSSLNNPDNPIYPSNIKTESGYYTFDNKLVFDRINSKRVKSNNRKTNNLTFECRKPTQNNPFMNPDITDYNTDKIIVACNDNNINDDINRSFDSGLFKNIEDVLSGQTSIRQFYTVPNTEIPNHQTEFSEWLYKAPSTCKEDQSKCLRQEDLRYKRSLFI